MWCASCVVRPWDYPREEILANCIVSDKSVNKVGHIHMSLEVTSLSEMFKQAPRAYVGFEPAGYSISHPDCGYHQLLQLLSV